MIDTHSHILSGMDDGAADLTESIEFVKTAAAQGVHTIFATPHAFNGVFNCTKENIIQACDTLTKALYDEGILTRILPGSEIRVNHDIIAEYDKGNLLTLNNSDRWLLLELPDVFMANSVCLMIRQLKERGLTPIIAHAERNLMVINKPELINEFIYNGAVIQITAGSLANDFGKFSMKAAKQMLSRDQVFCLGSDIHPGRKYRMADAQKKLIKLLGRTKTDMITKENPAAILEDTDCFYKSEYRKKAY